MERFDANISTREAAFQQRPEVFESVGMNLPVNVAMGMVDNLMRIVCCQSFIREQGVTVERSPGDYVLSDFVLQYCLATIRNNYRVNQPATFQDAHNGSLIASASTSDAAFAFADVHVAGFAADE